MPQRVNALRFPLNWRPGFAKLWSELAPSDRVEAWKPWYATQTLVHAGNYERVLASLRPALYDTPFTALDIETSVPEESLAWMEQTRSRGAKGVDVDTLGSMLTGMSLTFGDNSQHTIYVTVDHREDDVVRNIKSEQARALVELTPQATHTVIHNRAFEFPVLRNEWGQAWESNGWHGFVPNALDTKIEASYVNENLPLGLKRLAFLYLNYKQDSYDETTTLQGPIGTLQRGGVRLRTFKHCVRPARMEMCLNDGGEQEEFEVEPAVYEEWEARQYQMNELSAAHVFGYGCDDTRVTAALHNWFRIVMELEGTWNTYLMVEQYPEYLTSLAYMTGIPVDLGLLSRMEAEDRATLAEAENKLDSFLVAAGWDGTVLPEISELTTATAKQAIEIVLGPVGVSEDGEPIPFSTRKRKLEAIAEDVEEAYPDSETALLLANALRENALPVVKALVEQHFTGRPNINFGSPKQMQRLLYDVIGITPRVFNKLTDKQREDEEFRSAFYSRRDFEEGKMDREPTEFERKVWMSKASTDDDAVEVALFRDELSDESRDVLKAYLNIKTMRTRISLFYNAYAVIPHWKDGLVHSQFNQCQAATRRWSSSEPNLQQLPSRGEGVKFRDLLPAPLNYVYVSLDWSGQELRLMADYSQDANMLACYIGDNLMDIHSLVAVRAAPFIWGSTTTYEEFQLLRSSDEADVAKKAKSLRDGAKVTNFATQYGAQAPKVAIQLKTDEDTAQQFIDAKDDTFPGINRWKAEVEQEAETTGISTTMLGTPRHLRDLVMSPNSWVRSKAARQASNFCIQGSGAEMAKLALSRLWLSGAFIGGYRAQFVGPIHDEVVFLVHRDDVLPVVRLAHAIMRAQYANMTVPLESSLAIGLTFKAEVELGESFTDEQVLQAVQALFVKDDEEVVA